MKRKMSLLLMPAVVFQSLLITTLKPISVAAQTVQQQTVLTNAEILQMLKAGLSESLIVAKIRSSATKFDTSPTALQNLKQSGASDAVMLAMVEAVQPKTIVDSANNTPSAQNLGT